MKIFLEMRIRSRLMSSFGLMIFLSMVITAFGIFEVMKINQALTQINDVNSVKQRYAINFRGSVHDRAISLRDLVLLNDKAAMAEVTQEIEQLTQDYDAAAEGMDALFEQVGYSEGERPVIERIQAIEDKTLPLINQIMAQRHAGEYEAPYNLLITQARPAFSEWLAAINVFIDLKESNNKLETDIARNTGKRFIYGISAISGFSVLMGVVCIFAINLSITKPLSRTRTEMLALAEGDKSVEISSEDRMDEVGDIARALAVFKTSAIKQDQMAEKEKNMMASRQRKTDAIERLVGDFEQKSSALLKDVLTAAERMTTTSGHLVRSAEETSNRSRAVSAAAEDASSNVHTVASAAEELSSSINEINSQVRQSSSIAEAAVTEVNENVQTMRRLEESSSRIGEVVQLISEIAEQTNLLALNATIESARAGEAGKGFAVVASEVKNLANQTARATEEISGQIQEIQQIAKGAMTAIEDVGKTVHNMSEISGSVALSIEQQGAATLEISRSVQDASAGTSEVTSNIHTVSKVSGETDAAARSVSTVAAEVSELAMNLRKLLEGFSEEIKAV